MTVLLGGCVFVNPNFDDDHTESDTVSATQGDDDGPDDTNDDADDPDDDTNDDDTTDDAGDSGEPPPIPQPVQCGGWELSPLDMRVTGPATYSCKPELDDVSILIDSPEDFSYGMAKGVICDPGCIECGQAQMNFGVPNSKALAAEFATLVSNWSPQEICFTISTRELRSDAAPTCIYDSMAVDVQVDGVALGTMFLGRRDNAQLPPQAAYLLDDWEVEDFPRLGLEAIGECACLDYFGDSDDAECCDEEEGPAVFETIFRGAPFDPEGIYNLALPVELWALEVTDAVRASNCGQNDNGFHSWALVRD